MKRVVDGRLVVTLRRDYFAKLSCNVWLLLNLDVWQGALVSPIDASAGVSLLDLLLLSLFVDFVELRLRHMSLLFILVFLLFPVLTPASRRRFPLSFALA